MVKLVQKMTGGNDDDEKKNCKHFSDGSAVGRSDFFVRHAGCCGS